MIDILEIIEEFGTYGAQNLVYEITSLLNC